MYIKCPKNQIVPLLISENGVPKYYITSDISRKIYTRYSIGADGTLTKIKTGTQEDCANVYPKTKGGES